MRWKPGPAPAVQIKSAELTLSNSPRLLKKDHSPGTAAVTGAVQSQVVLCIDSHQPAILCIHKLEDGGAFLGADAHRKLRPGLGAVSGEIKDTSSDGPARLPVEKIIDRAVRDG